MIGIRPFQPTDWDVLLELANQAVPFAPQENAEWLGYRKAFDESKYARRHYLATSDGAAVGYGCFEQGDDPVWLHIFVVCNSDNLPTVGDMLYVRLLQEARVLGAKHFWAREYQADEPICEFFSRHGFTETKRFTLENQRPMIAFKFDLEG